MSLGLFGTLEVAKSGLNTNRQGIEITGHNLANISNPAYARQRLKIQTAEALPGPNGPAGSGAKVASIEQVRDKLIDSEIVNETSVTGRLQARQKALEFAEVNLGQQLDRQASTPEGATASHGVGGQFGLVEGLSDFFNAWQALSTSPNSTADRQVVLLKAESLTEKFNTVYQRLSNLRTDLNTRVQDDIAAANELLTEISDLSKSIGSSETGGTGSANDLRDRRQEKLEALSRLVKFQSLEDTQSGAFDLWIGSGADLVTLINDNSVATTLQTSDGGVTVEGRRAADGATVTVKLSEGGSIEGTIFARNGDIADVSTDLDKLALELITAVNNIHKNGKSLDSTTDALPSTDPLSNADFFTGTSATSASTITLNSVIRQDPNRIRASGESGEPGNNSKALQLAQLGHQPQLALGNLTFVERYNQTVANLGQDLSNVTTQLQDQGAVNRMLQRQRDSISGVSVDEEMANLLIFQRAFQASARMITTLDELLQSVIALGK